MKKWTAYVRIRGFDFIHTQRVEIALTEDEYNSLEAFVSQGEPLAFHPLYGELCERAMRKADVQYEAGDTEVDYVVICDPGDLVRMSRKFVGRTFEWYADTVENECEFMYEQYKGDYYEVYVFNVCFDKNGTITKIKDVVATCSEIRNFENCGRVEFWPDYDTLAGCLEKDLTKVR